MRRQGTREDHSSTAIEFKMTIDTERTPTLSNITKSPYYLQNKTRGVLRLKFEA